MNKIIISEEAFVMMLAGAAEVFDKETYGMLLGKKRKKDFYIEYAVPHQSTIRTKNDVSVTKRSEKRLIESINFLKGYRYIGEFHSHPHGPNKLSKYDINDIRESGAGISILVSMEETDHYKPWAYDRKDKSLSGTIDDNYLVSIKAYRCADTGIRIMKLRLECDFIKKLNKKVKKARPAFFDS
ncbi:Mov34/MPN/PAD-1 family protein [Candidatus Woesearchaeota archaeon]|nr:Mov34/MPN/PAD-1 family protein [Candidatus Woesearchaeota archaeon]